MPITVMRGIVLSGILWSWLASAGSQSLPVALQDHGTLMLSVPDDWTSKVTLAQGNQPPMVVLMPAAVPPFECWSARLQRCHREVMQVTTRNCDRWWNRPPNRPSRSRWKGN